MSDIAKFVNLIHLLNYTNVYLYCAINSTINHA